ncbi:MAG: FeoC-like transcriptional regulator [Pontiellaceae bacterium]|jgi:DNA-binding MarR family transcriptional regulator|nr:FeoC-like transcriptional regulator [Pontiellaceae bacterium]
MLQPILSWLQERGSASLAELANHFHTELSAMEGMLELLERKGRIQRLENRCSRCKGCLEVKPEDITIFQYVEK